LAADTHGDATVSRSLYFCPRCRSTAHGPDETCSLEGKCLWCKKRPATLHFGDMLSFTHGGTENCCALCAAKQQLDHARERAALIPELEAEVERLTKELGE